VALEGGAGGQCLFQPLRRINFVVCQLEVHLLAKAPKQDYLNTATKQNS
jgi:hypothetical protein